MIDWRDWRSNTASSYSDLNKRKAIRNGEFGRKQNTRVLPDFHPGLPNLVPFEVIVFENNNKLSSKPSKSVVSNFTSNFFSKSASSSKSVRGTDFGDSVGISKS